jgi:hypothetical protein
VATYTKFNDFVEQLGLKTHNLSTDTLKVMLTNSAPVATNTVKTDITEISAGNGYTAGGDDITNTWSESSGTATLGATDVTFTASGGTIGPFRYAVIYNDTATSDNLVCWFDYGSSITLADTETFTVDFGASLATLT